jgi:hypothetical protein
MRLWLLAAGLLAFAAPAGAQEADAKAHMEGCLKWHKDDRGYSAFNQCDAPIAIKFMMLQDRRLIEGEAPPGGRFSTETSLGGMMIFTACPVGYQPSVRFAAENAKQIAVSLYNCLPLGRPNS